MRRQKGLCLCDSRSIADRYIDRLVGKAVTQLLQASRDEVADQTNNTQPPSPTQRPTSAQKLLERRARTVEAYISGVWASHPDGGIAERDKRLMQIDTELKSMEDAPSAKRPDLHVLGEFLDTLGDSWQSVSQENKRKLMHSLQAVITVRTERGKRLWVELETPWGIQKAKTEW
jgi:hypothetical protein